MDEQIMKEYKMPYIEIEYTYNISEKFGKEEIKVKTVGEFPKAEIERMIKERMARKGMIKDRKKDLWENKPEDSKKETKTDAASKNRKPSRKSAKIESAPEEEAG